MCLAFAALYSALESLFVGVCAGEVVGKKHSAKPFHSLLPSVKHVPFNKNFHLILVSWTWFPQGWWILSFGKLQKALGRTAQVRPSFLLLWEEPMSGCRPGREADGAKPLDCVCGGAGLGAGFSSYCVQIPPCPSYSDERAYPDDFRPLRAVPLSITSYLSNTGF